jgi:hypothetical protein
MTTDDLIAQANAAGFVIHLIQADAWGWRCLLYADRGTLVRYADGATPLDAVRGAVVGDPLEDMLS